MVDGVNVELNEVLFSRVEDSTDMVDSDIIRSNPSSPEMQAQKLKGECLMHTLQGKIASRSLRVAIIDLGYVGLSLARVFAEAGFRVIGIDGHISLQESLLPASFLRPPRRGSRRESSLVEKVFFLT